MKPLLILLLLLGGCDTITEHTNGCTKRDVDGTKCIVCNLGHAVSCDWSKEAK